MSDRVRIMRIVIYDGPREWVERTVERSINGVRVIDPRDTVPKIISGFTLTQFPEIIKQHEEGIKDGLTI